MNQIVPIAETAETVTLSRGDYEALMESMETAASKAAFERTRDEESFSAEVVAQLLSGVPPVKVYRAHRGLTVRALAGASGLSAAYVSDIENGKRTGSVDALKAIAKALDVDFSDIA